MKEKDSSVKSTAKNIQGINQIEVSEPACLRLAWLKYAIFIKLER